MAIKSMKAGLDRSTQSKRRKAYKLGESRKCPIIIDGSDSEKPKKRQQRRRKIAASPQKRASDNAIAVRELLRSSQKIVVISGAGISTNAGFPTFQELRKSKMAPLNRSLYFFSQDISRFHSTILKLFEHLQSDSCMPTPFHRLMDSLAHEKRLLHHITQNFDCIEQRLPALEAKTVRLHGRLDQMRCQKCNQVCGLGSELLQRADLPGCQECMERSRARSFLGKRPLSIGRLKPDIVLCGEPHPDDNEIVEAVENGVAMRPDLVLVVGTKLERDGPRSMVTRLCKAARCSGGVAIWISKEEPAFSLGPLFDYILMGDCDAVASFSLHGFR